MEARWANRSNYYRIFGLIPQEYPIRPLIDFQISYLANTKKFLRVRGKCLFPRSKVHRWCLSVKALSPIIGCRLLQFRVDGFIAWSLVVKATPVIHDISTSYHYLFVWWFRWMKPKWNLEFHNWSWLLLWPAVKGGIRFRFLLQLQKDFSGQVYIPLKSNDAQH